MDEFVNLLPFSSTFLADPEFFQLLNSNEEVSNEQNHQVPVSVCDIINKGGNTIEDRHSWPGTHQFECIINQGSAWYYSEPASKLYVSINTPVPIKFKTLLAPPKDSVIKAVVRFTHPLKPQELIKCCPSHVPPMHPTRVGTYNTASSHFIRCESLAAIYDTDGETGENSVTVPYELPQHGSENSTYLYQFMCLSSCPLSANRRPICITFSLESNGVVLGRAVVNLKVCKCPSRDFRSDVQKNENGGSTKRKSSHKLNSTDVRPGKRLKVGSEVPSTSEGFEYKLAIKDKQHYDILSSLLKSLEQYKLVPKENLSDIQGEFTPNI